MRFLSNLFAVACCLCMALCRNRDRTPYVGFFKWVGRYSPGERLLRLFRFVYAVNGGPANPNKGYSAKLSLGLTPRLFAFSRGWHEWGVTLFGFRVHHLKSYGGWLCGIIMLLCLSQAVQAQPPGYRVECNGSSCKLVPTGPSVQPGYSTQPYSQSYSSSTYSQSIYSQPSYYSSPAQTYYQPPSVTYVQPSCTYYQPVYASPPRRTYTQTWVGPFGGTYQRSYSAGGSSCGNPYCGCGNCRCVNCACGY